MNYVQYILIAIVIVFFVIFALEVAERIYVCPVSKSATYASCDYKPYNLKNSANILPTLKQKRLDGATISKKEYRDAFEKLIIEVDPKVTGAMNGRACIDFGIVRNDLPAQSKQFVKRHELEHLLQADDKKNHEFFANLAAAKEYPRGLIQTIVFSLRARSRYYESYLCYILSLWKTFKTYFLPF